MKVSMAVENAKWEAERDARTLKDYADLKSDARRYKKAIEYIEEETSKLSKVVSSIKED